MKVPFVDFSEQLKEIQDEIQAGLKDVFTKGSFILGPQEKEFEAAFAKYSQAKHGIGVNSGTDALFLALKALGIGLGDEVIVPAFTFIATALAVTYTGAKVVFADIQKDSHNLDPQSFEKAMTKKTKAVIPVHLYGQPADMDEILAIARKHKLAVIEDAAQAHGAFYKNKRIGSLADIACFSFYPTKNLGAFGDGGMVLTGDDKIAEQVRMLRDYGRRGRYDHIMIGYNSRLDTVQAVVLAAKLKRLDQWSAMRQACAQKYAALLKDIPGLQIPAIKPDRTHVFHIYGVAVRERNQVVEKIQEKGIGALIHFPIPLHLQEAYKDLGYQPGDFPAAEDFANKQLSLPMFPHMQGDQIEYVASTLKDVLKNA
ncbi:MAG: DegT/DnrJ/EryC1/StrS family aminotransferase [Candidatus Omnitrophota bacterium]